MCKADGYPDDDVLTIPDDVGGRYSVFTPAGLLPAAVMGLDVRALLLGAAAMTKRFLEEPFERNPVLQYAAANHLLAEDLGKTTRVLAVWGKKLEAVGWWYDQLVAESLGKFGRGPTPLTAVYPRDLHGRGQQHLDGPRDKAITNLMVRQTRHQPVVLGMSDRNEDDLNALSRKGHPDILDAAQKGAAEAYQQAARPTAVNLAWGVRRLLRVAADEELESVDEVRDALLVEAQRLADEDVALNRRMGYHGAELISDGDTILHHCNTGALATVDWGTALGVVFAAHEQGKRVHVLVDETRPRLQGAQEAFDGWINLLAP